jgi:hypothetical protein
LEINVKETVGTIKNVQSTGNIEYIRDRTKTNTAKRNNTTEKTKTMSSTDPTKNRG